MALIHPSSLPAATSSIASFLVPKTEVAVEKTLKVCYLPISSIDGAKVHQFNIPPYEHFIDLSGLALEVNGYFEKTPGTKPTNDERIYPVNYMLHAIYEQVDVKFGETKITPATNTYGLKAVIEADLFSTWEAKATVLTAAGWDEDEDDREKMVRGGKSVQLYGHLHLDFGNQPKFLIPQVPLTVSLTRSNDLHLVSKITKATTAGTPPVTTEAADTTWNPSFKITGVKLWVKKVKVIPDLLLALEKQLLKNTAKYHIRRGEVITINVPHGQSKVTLDNVIKGQLPRLLVFALIKNSTFAGSNSEDLFVFNHHNIRKFITYVNGEMYPLAPYEPNFADNNYSREYAEIFSELEMDHGEPTFYCSMREFKDSKCFFAVNLAPNYGGGYDPDTVPPIRHGTVRVDIQFTENLQNPMTLVAYGQYDNLIQIDHERNISLDY